MTVPADISPRFARWGVALVWLVCAAMLIWSRFDNIVHLTFTDPDDALRMVQVRDWMAGQSWFDVSQHRAWPPHGAPMHWSRLVDLPIAGIMAVAGLFASPALAVRIAVVAVPLLTLLCLFVIVHALTRRVSGRRDMALVAVVMLAMSLGVLVQFHPLRIDHHGWHIVLSALGSLMLVSEEQARVRCAALAGVVMAVSLTIAIEGLPLAVGIGAVLGLRYLWRENHGAALTAYLLALSTMSALLSIIMLGWPAAAAFWCDSLSPAYLIPIGAMTLVLLAMRCLPQDRPAMRFVALALAGGTGAASFAGYSHQCLAGPFAALDPLVFNVWYVHIDEGMPIWAQSLDLKILIPLPAIIGMLGTLLAIRLDVAKRRESWLSLLFLQILSFAVSLTVMRAMGIAHVLALPGSAFLFLTAFRAATGLRMSAARIMLGVGSVVLTPVGAEAIAASLLPVSPTSEAPGSAEKGFLCTTYGALRGLDALPPTIMFAPLDIGSHLLAYTHHSVVATGHHRNRPGMKAVISAFIARPEQARAIVQSTGAQYLLFCPGADEVDQYARLAPHGLMAALLQRHEPDWLKPVPMRKGEPVRVYRIVRSDQAATKRSATPFMQ